MNLVLATLLYLQLVKGIAFVPNFFGFDFIFIASWFFIIVNFRQIWRGLRFQKFLIISTLVFSLSLLLSSAVNGVEYFQTFGILNYLSILIISFHLGRESFTLVRGTLVFVVFFHTAVAITELALRQSFFYSTWKNLDAIYVGVLPRASSTIGDPNYLAFGLITIIATLGLLATQQPQSALAFFAKWVAIALVPFTFSRSGTLAAGLVILGSITKSLRSFVGVTLGAMSIVTFVYLFNVKFETLNDIATAISVRITGIFSSDPSVTSRGLVQDYGQQIFSENLIFGVGAGQFEKLSTILLDPSRPLNLQTQVLNTYLEVLLAGGLIAALPFFALLIKLFLGSWQLGINVFSGYASVLLMLFTLDTLESPYLWLTIGTWFGFQSNRSES